MAFVPLADSGLTYDVIGDGGLAGSEYVLPSGGDGWIVWFSTNDPVTVRLTVLEFGSDGGFEYDGTSRFANGQASDGAEPATIVQNQAADPNTEFSPTQFTLVCPFDDLNGNYPGVSFNAIAGPSENTPQYIMRVLIEVDVEDATYTNEFNCNCDCGYPTKTLLELQREVATLMGYASQLAALPPGFAELVRVNLNTMQKLVVSDISEIQNDRYFSWNTTIGGTKYCTTENLETCRRQLVATRIREVYFIQAGNQMTRLRKGIPVMLHSGGEPSSIPSLYEVRSCIEIWPPPSVAGRLIVKGTLAAVPLVEQDDPCMVDDTALVLRTVAFMKAAKGHQDAQIYFGQYQDYIGTLCSDSHIDMRYIPPGNDGLCADDDFLTARIHPPIFMGE